ncbi:MAG: class I SAM-dependent rRNA methyltransferase [Fimbriimonadaceae bacterium]
MRRVFLREGREKKIQNRYPWVQREEVSRVGGTGDDGELAELLDSKGSFLARGTYNGAPRFPFRVFTLDPDEVIDTDFFVRRFSAAKERRSGMEEAAVRWIHAEADGCPGLIVDGYREHLVVQVRSLGMQKLREAWVPALKQVFEPESAYERSDMEGRKEEGLEPYMGPIFGRSPAEISVEEDGLEFLVRPQEGLKTGFYMDQRATRRAFESRVKPGEKVLDCFCYTGAFTLRAARAGAEATGVDILPLAVETAQEHAKRNDLEASFIEANAFEYLEHNEENTEYDWILLDPPAISKSGKTKDSLKWAIWNLVYHSLPRLAPGGRLLVCSCSYQLSLNALLDTVRLATSDRGRAIFLEDVTYQDIDHPAPLHFPEALYLKCAWLRAE